MSANIFLWRNWWAHCQLQKIVHKGKKRRGRWWEEADLIPFTSTLCQSILEWPVDKSAISPVIQPHDSSREASSRPGTAVHPKEHDARSKADIRWRQSTKFPRRVPARCFVFPQTCDNKMSQWQSMCTVHSILLTRCQSCWSWSTKMEQHQMHCDAHKLLICAKGHLLLC